MWGALDTDDVLRNGLAVAWFLACCLGYGPLVKLLWRKGGAINIDMEFVHRRWMQVMAHRREQRLIDIKE